MKNIFALKVRREALKCGCGPRRFKMNANHLHDEKSFKVDGGNGWPADLKVTLIFKPVVG